MAEEEKNYIGDGIKLNDKDKIDLFKGQEKDGELLSPLEGKSKNSSQEKSSGFESENEKLVESLQVNKNGNEIHGESDNKDAHLDIDNHNLGNIKSVEQNNDSFKISHDGIVAEDKVKEEDVSKDNLMEVDKVKEEDVVDNLMEVDKVKEEDVSKDNLMEVDKVKEEDVSKDNLMEVDKVKEEDASKDNLMEVDKVKEENVSKDNLVEVDKVNEEDVSKDNLMEVDKVKEEDVVKDKAVEITASENNAITQHSWEKDSVQNSIMHNQINYMSEPGFSQNNIYGMQSQPYAGFYNQHDRQMNNIKTDPFYQGQNNQLNGNPTDNFYQKNTCYRQNSETYNTSQQPMNMSNNKEPIRYISHQYNNNIPKKVEIPNSNAFQPLHANQPIYSLEELQELEALNKEHKYIRGPYKKSKDVQQFRYPSDERIGNQEIFLRHVEEKQAKKQKIAVFLQKDNYQIEKPDLRGFLNLNHAVECLLPYHIFYNHIYEDYLFKETQDTSLLKEDLNKTLQALENIQPLINSPNLLNKGLTCELLMYYEQRYLNNLHNGKSPNNSDIQHERKPKQVKKKNILNKRNTVFRLKYEPETKYGNGVSCRGAIMKIVKSNN